MANVSATCLSYKSSLNLPTSTISSQGSYRNSSLRTVSFVGWTRSRGSYFPSLRTSGFRISCTSAQDETVQKVCDVVRKQLALPPESVVTPNTKFSELGADSLDTVEIVMSLEEEFGISVEQENSENITTVQDAAELIEKLVQTKASSGEFADQCNC